MSPNKGQLLLLPNLLEEELSHEPFFPPSVGQAVQTLQGIIAESEKSARRFLRRFLPHERFSVLPIRLLNEHTHPSELDALLQPMKIGETWGLISDAGLPCIADPGSSLVLGARACGIAVHTFTGPSSILMALQLSGLGGQRFSFNGYLPRESNALQQMLKTLEKRSREEKSVQIWIEAPYRSAKLVENAIQILSPKTFFSIALELTTPQERVFTQRIQYWKKHPPIIEKERGVFLLIDID